MDLDDNELKATREMNKTVWESEIDKWSKEYLIERYKDLVEIEKEHKKENGELREEVERLENADLTILYMNGFYDAEKKWKNKIKEIIEELEKQEDWYIENKSLDDLYGKIDILQELLEERN